MITTNALLVVTGILLALLLAQSISALRFARKHTELAVSRFKDYVGCPERDTESPVIFIEAEDQTADSIDGCLTSDLDVVEGADSLGIKTVSTSMFDRDTSWSNLLGEWRRIESDSQNWERLSWRVHHGINQPDILENGILRARAHRNGSQSPISKRSNSIPTTFAITSIRHIIELSALLGLRWITLERHRRYFAAGNGLVLSGAREKGIGIVFELQRNSPFPFVPARRIIPASGIRELCFGVVSTFYREIESNDTYCIPLDTPAGLEVLRVGTRDKFAKTLFIIGCSRESIASYVDRGEGMGLIPGRTSVPKQISELTELLSS